MKISKSELRALIREVIGEDQLLEVKIDRYAASPNAKEFVIPKMPNMERNNLRNEQRQRINAAIKALKKERS